MTGSPALPLSEHLLVVLVLLPLGTAALMLALGQGRRTTKAVLNVASTTAGLSLAVMLLAWVHGQDAAAAFAVYLPGNWPVPYGIVLVADRLSALMVVLAGSVGLAAVLYALARWHQAGVHFHALLQLQLAGLYGAFLTADLFNLFVFFEVMLAASYGLLLHGGGNARVRAGLHYIAINLVASLLFLIGVAVLYGVTGTLNMADIAAKLPLVPKHDHGLLHAGAAILGLAFLTKAAIWPLCFWLPPAYTAASAPAAALFVILTKVGFYAVVRLWTLCFPSDAGDSAFFGSAALVWGGIATVVFGSIGMLASQHLGRLAGYSIITSSGTLLAAIGLHEVALGTGALFYLASSTWAACALFLLVELLERARDLATPPPRIDDGQPLLTAFGESEPPPDINLDDDARALVGRALPAALAFLGLAFAVCALVIAGLPPMSGFVGKLAMLAALLEEPDVAKWVLFASLIVSGLLAALALLRVGMRQFWSAMDGPPPRLRLIEMLPVALLLGACVMLVIRGEAALDYARRTAEGLHAPHLYIEAVLAARPRPSAAVDGASR